MVKFHEMKRNAHLGSAAVVVIMTAGVVALILGGITSKVSTRVFSQLTSQIASERSMSVFDAVLYRSISDLSSEVNKPSDGSQPSGGIDHLLRLNQYTEKNPKIYAKGLFEVQVRSNANNQTNNVVKTDGSQIKVQSMVADTKIGFYSPETDPKVWLETVEGIPCYYKVHIEMDLCKSIVTGRTAFYGTLDNGLGKSYNFACPAKDIKKINYIAFLDPAASAFSSDYKAKCVAQRPIGGKPPVEKTSNGYWRTLVMHSFQETFVEPCPAGFNSIYEGYSFAGTGMEYYGWSVQPQDLADPGSCQPVWQPANNIKCDYDNCDYASGSFYSFWLISQSKLSAGWSRWVNNRNDREDVRSRISRCRVCEGPKPIKVVHSYKAEFKQENINGKIETVDVWPTCEEGYKMLWPGFSLGSLFAGDNAEFKMREDDTGSCIRLPLFNLLVRCFEDQCHWSWEHGDESTLFLANLATTDRRTINNDERSGNHIRMNRNRISRCTVCVKK